MPFFGLNAAHPPVRHGIAAAVSVAMELSSRTTILLRTDIRDVLPPKPGLMLYVDAATIYAVAPDTDRTDNSMHNPSSPDTSAQIDVIPLEERHLGQALEQSQALKWPYRLEDWAFALKLGRGFAVELDGRLVGTALWWPYGEDFASAGMIIVANEAQRKGIGAKLMAALLADAKGRRIILNSTKEGKTLYTRLGFTPCDTLHQHQAVLAEAPPLVPSVPLRAATPKDRDTLLGLDRAASGMDRTALFDALSAIGDMVVVSRDDRVTGYACVRRWGRGVVVGPVVARDTIDARALISALAARHAGEFVRIDVTASCGLSPWLETIGLPQTDDALCMSLGEPPQRDPGITLYAVSNQSLG
jgi:GNAT superfamily N-acetyltransferase